MATQVAVCTNVIDGATFEIADGTRIRLARVNAWRIETPEGQRARDLLTPMVLNKVVTCIIEAIDDHGRSVAEAWADGKNISDIMISHGYKR